MNISGNRRAIGRFSRREEAESALYALRDAGFNMDKVSVITQGGAPESMSGAEVTNADQVKGGATIGATAGAATGGVLGLIGGLGVLAIPGVGPAAELGIVLANTLLGSGIGAAGGGLIGALIGWGVPEDQAKYFNERISQGDYIILIEGTETEVRNAESIFNNQGIYDWETFNAPATTAGIR